MSFFGSSPIIKDGLILYYDAANPKSYTPSGGTIDNLVSLEDNGVITGGTTYDSSKGGVLVFDGTSGYVTCGNSENLQFNIGSYSAWFKGVQQGSSFNGIVVKQLAWGIYIFQSNLTLYDFGDSAEISTGINVSDNIWRNICVTFQSLTGATTDNTKVYVNGINVLTATVTLSSQSEPVLIGYGNSVGQFLSGSVSNVQLYDRVLSDNEVLQNYNALKPRFGL